MLVIQPRYLLATVSTRSVGDDDPHVERKKAARALARTLTFHEINLRTRTEVMVEHFRTHVRHKIGGRAKAMVVTEGRLHAVRYKQASGPAHLEDEVELQYYRLQKISEGQIDLTKGDGQPLKGPGDVGTGQQDETIRLSELIDILNERFGTDFTQADQLFFDQIQEEAIESETLRKAAATNSKEDFRYVFEKAFEGLVIDRMDGNEDIFGKLMSDGEFRRLAMEHLLHKVYGALKTGKASDQPRN